ncbi:AMP-binding protein [Streptomyces varsoviensis]|uniref:class I adenylate-forming enzyme family protein n=1 Tax=Streptomyces varsoviensis TaxID=67373 RepID=UPI0033FC6DC9
MSASEPRPGGLHPRPRPRTIAEQFARVEAAYGDRPALCSAEAGGAAADTAATGREARREPRWLTFAEVAILARAAVSRLAALGAAPGDRIVLALPNSVILRVLDRAVLGAGLVRVALSPRLHAREIADIAVDCDARVVCCRAEAEADIHAALAEAGSAARVAVCSDAPGNPAGGPERPGDAPKSPGDAPERPGHAPKSPADGPESSGDAPNGPGDAANDPADAPNGPAAAPNNSPADAPEAPRDAPNSPDNTPEDPGRTATHLLSPDALAAAAADSAPGEAAWPAPAPADVAMLMYSSGTTGRPKGVVVTHATWVAQTARALRELPAIGPGDVVLAVAPMSHFGGSIGLDCAVSGAATVTMAHFDPREVLAAVDAFGVTVLPLAPIMLDRVARAAEESAGAPPPRGIRAVPYGGSPIDLAALERAERVFPGVLTQFYGLAEALAPLTVLTPADHASGAPGRLGSAGRAVDGIGLRLVDGEVVVRGDTVMEGYWNRPELTAAAFADGWFRTGDLAEIDADGYVRLLGRSSEMIVTGGFNVYPAEVERVLCTVDGIHEAAVLGMPHPVWGEGVTAAVVLDGGGPPGGGPRAQAGAPQAPGAEILDGIARACAAALAGYKKPVAVYAVPEIPRNAAGKTDRQALRRSLPRHLN